MPFFIARLNTSGRIVTVDQTAYGTAAVAEEQGRARYPHERTWAIEATDSHRAALLASEQADAWKPGMIIAERLEDDSTGRRRSP